MQIELRKSAVKDLNGLPKRIKDIIHFKISQLADFPTIAMRKWQRENKNKIPDLINETVKKPELF